MKRLLNIKYLRNALLCFSLGLFLCQLCQAQTQYLIEGTFTNHPFSNLFLYTYEGFEKIKVDSAFTNKEGFAQFKNIKSLDSNYELKVEHINTSLDLLPEKTAIIFSMNSIHDYQSLHFFAGKNNQSFSTFSQQKQRNSPKIEVLSMLMAKYDKGTAFYQTVAKEKSNLEKQQVDFINNLEGQAFVKKYIAWLAFLEDLDVATIKGTPQSIIEIQERFNRLKFEDKELQNSGLMHLLIINYYNLLEQKSNTETINLTTDKLVSELLVKEEILQLITKLLIKNFEDKGLLKEAEHLSLRILEENSCIVEDGLVRRLEQYRKMKVGSIAPDFKALTATSDNPILTSSDYTLIVFNAIDCNHCQMELPQLAALYPQLKDRGIEVVSISLDTDRAAYEQKKQQYDWVNYCDFKKWDSPLVQAYYVFNTPSFFLLNKDRQILLKPTSVADIRNYLNKKSIP